MSRRKFGAVRRLPSGRWQARLPGPGGELLPGPQMFATKAEASRYLAAMETDMARGQWVDPRGSSVLLRDYSRAWLQERTVRGRPLAPRTTDTYRHSLDASILPTLGDLPLDKITPAHVRRWHAHVSSQTGVTAVRQAYAVLRAVLNTAVADEALHRNPCRIKGAGQAHTPERPLLGLDEVDALVAAMPADLRTLTTLAFWAHTRLGEVLALRRGDVLLDKGQLRIERQAVEVDGHGARITEPKAGSRRTVNLPTPAVDALRQHLQGLPPGLPSAPLFTRPDGSELRAHHVHYAWKFARVKAGLPDAHFHDLRHAGLTLSAQAGATLAEVMRRAGHSSAAAALRYQHAADERDTEIAARLSALAKERSDRSTGSV
jgi:integrase